MLRMGNAFRINCSHSCVNLFLKISSNFSSINYFRLLFAGDNYDELIDALEGTLPSVGPQAENYIDTLVANSNAQEQAQESGNRCQLAQILDKGAVDTAAGAYHLKSNPELYQLASVEAPSELAALADGVASGYYDNEDVYNAVGNFNQEVREATQQPLNS